MGSKTWRKLHSQDSPHSRAIALTPKPLVSRHETPKTAGSRHGGLAETSNALTRHKLWIQTAQDPRPKTSVTGTDGLCSAPGPRPPPSACPPAPFLCQAPGTPPLPGPLHPSPCLAPGTLPLPGPRHPSSAWPPASFLRLSLNNVTRTLASHMVRMCPRGPRAPGAQRSPHSLPLSPLVFKGQSGSGPARQTLVSGQQSQHYRRARFSVFYIPPLPPPLGYGASLHNCKNIKILT